MPRAALAIKSTDPAPPWAAQLTQRERRFVEEYIIDLSGKQAAIRAGLGKTPKSATEIASRMRRKATVAEAISALIAERSGATSSRIIEELGKLAFADLTDVVRVENGRVVVTDTAELSSDQRASIAEISETIGEGGRTIKVKMHDKLSAIDKLAKVLSLYKERVEVSGPNGGAIPVEHTIADVRSKLDARMARLRKALTGDLNDYVVEPPLRRVAPVPVRAIGRIIDAE